MNDGRILTCHIDATRRYYNGFEIPAEKNCQPKIQCPVKTSLGNEAEVKTFSGEGKVREFNTSRSVVQEVLTTVLQLRGQRGKLGIGIDFLLFAMWDLSTFLVLCPVLLPSQPRHPALCPLMGKRSGNARPGPRGWAER